MRRLAYVTGAVVVLAAAALALASVKVSGDAAARAAAEKIGALTGYGVEVHGGAEASLWPLPGFEIRDVSLVLPAGKEREEVATIDILRGRIGLMSLMLGRVEIRDMVLIRPRLDLNVDRHGRPNWAMTRRGEVGANVGEPAEGAPPVRDVRIGSFRIEDGAIVYVNQRGGERQEISAIDAAISWSRLAAPLDASGTLIWNGKNVRFALSAGAPLDFLGTGTSTARIRVESGIVNVDFNGRALYTTDPQIEGAVRLTAPSARALMRWLGAEPGAGAGLNAIDFSGNLNMIGRSVSLSDLVVKLDDNEAEGVAKVIIGDNRTELQGTLAFETLDLGKYRGSPASAESQAPGGALAMPIDLSGLAGFAVDMRLSAAAVLFGDLKLGRSAGTITVRKGGIEIGVGESELYGGMAQGSVGAQPSEGRTKIKASLKFSKVDIGPLIAALSGASPVSGATTARISLNGTGTTVGEVIADLSGDARLSVAPGAIRGIDVATLAEALKAGRVEGWPATPASTAIDTLSATFTVAKGNASTDDFVLKGPNVEVMADGEIRLVSASLAGHGTAELAAPADTMSGGQPATFSVPFVIEGPFANPILFPDPVWLLNRTDATPEEIDRMRKDLQQSRPEEVVEDLLLRGFGMAPRLPPADQTQTSPQQ